MDLINWFTPRGDATSFILSRYSQVWTTTSFFFSSRTWASLGSLRGVTVGGSCSNNIHQVQWGCSNKAARLSCPPLPSPLSTGICLPADSADLAHYCLENVRACGTPASVERRRDGTDFLRGSAIEMKKSSDQPAPCAPGCHGPPAYCDSLHFASSWRTLQLTLGQSRSDHSSLVNDSTVLSFILA